MLVSKTKIYECQGNKRRVPTGTATQMMESMIDGGRLSRSDASDVSNYHTGIFKMSEDHGVNWTGCDGSTDDGCAESTDGDALSIVDSTGDRPNGLAFSPAEKLFYLADTGEPRNINVFDVSDDGKTLSNKRLFAEVRPGASDGFRVDEHGNIWTSARDGVQCYSPAGELLGKILIPEQATANLVFGGRDGKRMYICGDTSLYSVRVKVAGAHRCW